MKIRTLLNLAIAACAIITIYGCGGGGDGDGGGGGGGGGGVPTTQLVLAVQGTPQPAGAVIGGIDVTLNVPAGVTASTGADGATAAGFVNVSGNAAGGQAVAKYNTASGATPGQLRVAVIKGEGFAVGEFAVAKLDFGSTTPVASGFVVATLTVSDLNGAPITGLTVAPSIQVR